jgi:hypothetical protein
VAIGASERRTQHGGNVDDEFLSKGENKDIMRKEIRTNMLDLNSYSPLSRPSELG